MASECLASSVAFWGNQWRSEKWGRDAYQLWAATYDTQANKVRGLYAAVIRSANLPLDGKSVIELGAGTGKNSDYLAARAGSIVALDYSPAMLARARQRTQHRKVRFVEHDITQTWLVADVDSDIVIANLVLEHIAVVRPVFTEAHRVLRPGGLMFISELHHTASNSSCDSKPHAHRRR